jgi:hypothetical protein
MVRVVLSAFLLSLPVLVAGSFQSPSPAPGSAQGDRPTDEALAIALTIDRGEGELPLQIPGDETLRYRIYLDLPLVGRTRVGTFLLESEVAPHVDGLPRPGEEASIRGLAGKVSAEARGSYLSFRLDQDFELRYLPQEWPAVVFRDTKRGASPRRREMKYGVIEGEPTLSYRRDTHCRKCKRKEHYVEGGFFSKDHHCDGCKGRAEHRVWKDPFLKTVPAGGLDTLSAIFLSRSMAREGVDSLRFALLKKDDVWSLEMKRGKARKVKVPAGSFHCREIKFVAAAGLDDDSDEKFKSLFGMEGVVHIWLEELSGVPIMIAGTMPLGAFDVDVSIELATFRGTPPELVTR